jgi:hypothetical protein
MLVISTNETKVGGWWGRGLGEGGDPEAWGFLLPMGKYRGMTRD